jgi:hypothetical protein
VQGKLRRASQAGDNIVVVTRTRPFNTREKELRTTNCCRVLAEAHSGQQQVRAVCMGGLEGRNGKRASELPHV